MTISFNSIAHCLSKHARRAFAALILTGCISAPAVWADQSLSPPPSLASLGLKSNASPSEIDRWIFQEDYCGWASTQALLSPFAAKPLAKEPLRASHLFSAKPDTDSQLLEDIRRLALDEPIDAQVPPAAISDTPPIRISSAPVVVTIAEGYLPYDMSQSQPLVNPGMIVTIPQFSYVGGMRTDRRLFNGQGALDCLGYGVQWKQELSPVQHHCFHSASAQTTGPGFALPQEFVASLETAKQQVASHYQLTEADVDQKRAALVRWLVDAIQPQSQVRQELDAYALGARGAETFSNVYQVAARTAYDKTNEWVRRWEFKKPRTRSQELEESVGEKLLVRAGVEANSQESSLADVAVDATIPVCCPVQRPELASLPPATQTMAVVGVATASLSVPQEPSMVRDPIARAEAFATACDAAAATLEHWARSLRKAGDSVVRVAKTTAQEETTLR